MAVASVTKITAASSEGFDAAVRDGLARANKTLRGITGLPLQPLRALRALPGTLSVLPWMPGLATIPAIVG